jgi:beta-galactosidase
MKNALLVLALTLACVPRGGGAVREDSTHEETSNVTNPGGLRGSQTLNGDWHIAFDPENVGKQERWYEHFPSIFAAIRVPGVWNEIRPGYQGVAWYQKSFSVPTAWQDKSVRVRFGAVSYLAEVWLNGKYLGVHEGGYTPFEVEAGGKLLLGAENQLIVRVLLPPQTHAAPGETTHPQSKAVDGFVLEETPSSKQGWYDNFGGIWQDAALVISNRIRVEDCFIQPDIHAEKIDVQCQLNNQTGQNPPVAIALVANGKQEQANNGFRASKELRLPEEATTNVDLSVDIPHPKLWSPSQPFLYSLQVTLLQQGQPLDSKEFTFGMREFTVREHKFFLNDHPIVLKGALYQPHYPTTLAFPPTEDWFVQELRLAKNANLNFLRLHIKPEVPRLLELADEAGILLLEEPPIGWIEKSHQLRDRCRREVEQLILRDRNHPSLVMWGVLNETGGAALEIKDELAALVHELDPTRPVIDDSGGIYWTGEDTRIWVPSQTGPREMSDLHPYLPMPFNQAGFDYYRQLPRPHKLNFISEFGGLGGLEDLASVIREYGSDRPWQDKTRLEGLYQAFQKGFHEQGLESVFGDFSGFTRSSQKAHAAALTRMIDALRINPLTAGYVITQFNDASFEASYGLLDEWRHEKVAYGAAAAANEPLRVVVSTRVNQYAGELATVEDTIVNDEGRLGRGELTVRLQSTDGQVMYANTRRENLVGRLQTVPALHLVMPPREGTYRLATSLELGGQVVCQVVQEILVLKRPSPQDRLITSVALVDPLRRLSRRLGSFPLRIANYKREMPPQRVYVVGPIARSLFDYPLMQLKELIELAREGATLVALELPPDTAEVSQRFGLFPAPLSVTSIDEQVLFTSEWIRKHAITDGLPVNRVMDQTYAEVLPRHFLQQSTGDVVAGAVGDAFLTGWFQSLVVTPLGKGHLIVCQLELLDKLGRDPVADHLLLNLMRYAYAIATLPELRPSVEREAELEHQVSVARTNAQTELQRWAVLGPFDNSGRSGFGREYPPETAMHLERGYEGKDGTIVRGDPVTVWSSQQYRVPMSSREDLSDWTLWYAYTQIHTPTARGCRLVLTCQSGCRLWLNGREVIHSDVVRMNLNSVPVHLQPGWNRVLVKVDRTLMPESFFTLDVLGHSSEKIGDLRFNFTGEALANAASR